MVEAFGARRLRPVCASCGSPADEGRCATCRGWRPGPPDGGGPSGSALLLAAAALLVLWVALLVAWT